LEQYDEMWLQLKKMFMRFIEMWLQLTYTQCFAMKCACNYGLYDEMTKISLDLEENVVVLQFNVKVFGRREVFLHFAAITVVVHHLNLTSPAGLCSNDADGIACL